MFYLMTHSTHFIYGYIANNHSDSEIGSPLPPLHSPVPLSRTGEKRVEGVMGGLPTLAGTRECEQSDQNR